MTLEVSYHAGDEVVFEFSPVKDDGIYELTATLDGTERVILSPATKRSQEVYTRRYWYRVLSMKVSLKSLAMITKAKEVTIRLRDKEFVMKGDNLEALRLMVQHVSARPAP